MLQPVVAVAVELALKNVEESEESVEGNQKMTTRMEWETIEMAAAATTKLHLIFLKQSQQISCSSLKEKSLPLSDESKYITGHTLDVNGGLFMH